MRSQRGTATIGITLLVLSSAAQVSAEPITTFTEAYHFRYNIGPNSVGLPPGDRQFVGLLQVSPTAGTAVTATQGAVTRQIPFTPSTVFPTAFRSLEPFDPSLTGTWSITATNGPDSAGPLLTVPIANPQLVPFAQNLQVVGTGPTPTVTWSLPDLTGFDVDYLRFRVYNDASDDLIFNTRLPLATTAFTSHAGLLLVPGVPYVFSVSLHDSDENVSQAFTQSPYVVPVPVQLLVSSELTNSVKRYDGLTGAYLGEFVSAGVDGQVEPRGLTFGPDGNLYVGGGGDDNPNVKRFNGTTGAPIDIEPVTSGYPPRINGITFGPDGYLYGAVFESDSVFRVDVTTGALLPSIGAGSPLDGATGLTFGADGNLYVGSWYTGQVLRFDGTSGAFIDVFATVPPGGSTFDVRFGPDGDLYVGVWYCGPAGCLSGDIERFDGATGASKGSFIPSGDPRPVEPYTLLFAEGKLYVTSHATDEVLRYDGATGAFIDSVAVESGLNGPTGLALLLPSAPTSVLLVASHNTNSVKRYDGVTGAYLGDLVTAGGQANPRGMSLGPDGNLYVGGSSYGAPGSIRRFDGTTGAILGTVTSGHPGPIGDVIFGPDGDLYAPVLLEDYVIHVDPSTGALLGTIGAGSPLDNASGLAFGADGNLYVGSYPDNQVLRFDGTTGAFIDVFATVPIAGDAGHVGDVTFGPDGDLLATIGYAEPTGNIWRFDGTTGASLGAFIPAADPHPAKLLFPVFGPDGNLYVGSSPDQVLRYDGTTGAFIDIFASGGGLDGPFGLTFVPEPGASTQIGAGLAALIALARRRYRGSRRQTLPRA